MWQEHWVLLTLLTMTSSGVKVLSGEQIDVSLACQIKSCL
jgi:hypothetical protein